MKRVVTWRSFSCLNCTRVAKLSLALRVLNHRTSGARRLELFAIMHVIHLLRHTVLVLRVKLMLLQVLRVMRRHRLGRLVENVAIASVCSVDRRPMLPERRLRTRRLILRRGRGFHSFFRMHRLLACLMGQWPCHLQLLQVRKRVDYLLKQIDLSSVVHVLQRLQHVLLLLRRVRQGLRRSQVVRRRMLLLELGVMLAVVMNHYTLSLPLSGSLNAAWILLLSDTFLKRFVLPLFSEHLT